ncbi:MAG: glycerophosphodiester phosphodiesterase [Flavobacteriales bacterium]|nr:glycerophosphodiester phosphodiesterase [Flavobacteriales bacterium]
MNSQRNIEWHGHRGCRGLLPENTIPAFLKAIDLGMDYLEMDVVISKDHQVVIAHEPYMPSTICSFPDGRPVRPEVEKELNLYQMDYAEIAGFDCGRKHPGFPQQVSMPVTRPLLSELFDTIASETSDPRFQSIGFTIELKSAPEFDTIYHPPPEEFVDLVLQVIRMYGFEERCVLQSFDQRILKAFRSQAPNIRQSILLNEIFSPSEVIAELGYTPPIIGPRYDLLDQTLIADCHACSMRVVPWTVNEVEDMRSLIEQGVDGIITDYPDRKSLIVE